MADIAQAATCINYHQNVPANIRRTQVFLQFSANHKELKPDQVQYFVSFSQHFIIMHANCPWLSLKLLILLGGRVLISVGCFWSNNCLYHAFGAI